MAEAMRELKYNFNAVNIVDEVDDLQLLREVAHADDQESAFYVNSLQAVVEKVIEWQAKLPRVEPFYAVKCNRNENVLKTLAMCGCGFDCASKEEMRKVLDIGVPPEAIIFANPAKLLSDFRYARARNVRLTTFDNESELHKAASIYPNAELLLRLRCDSLDAQCPLGIKFGVEEDEAADLLLTAKKLGLNVVGVSFHVGSGCKEPPVFQRGIASAKRIFQTADDIGFNFDILDIGGGFPGNKGTSIDTLATIINEALDIYFPPELGVRIIAEPGRYFVASSFTLATMIHSVRQTNQTRIDDDVSDAYMYYVNDGLYGSFNNIVYDHAEVTPLPLDVPLDGGEFLKCSVWGPTCDGFDQICGGTPLPQLTVQDWIYFENMGAYTLCAASNFNGIPPPKVLDMIDFVTWLFLRDKYEEAKANLTIRSQLPFLQYMKSELRAVKGSIESLTMSQEADGDVNMAQLATEP